MGDDGKMPLDGSFGKTMPLCVGDPYHDPKMSGTHGVSKGQRQFLTTPGKKGQTANAVGYGPLEFKTLFSGGKDQYEDPHKMHVKERLKNVRGNRTPNGFMYSSPMKRSTSPGSMEGTFRGVIEHEGEGTYAARGRREKVENDVVAKRNVQTNPAKLGGFGVPNTLIGGNHEYMHSPYDAFGNAVRSERKKDKEKHGEKKARERAATLCLSRLVLRSGDRLGALVLFLCAPPARRAPRLNSLSLYLSLSLAALSSPRRSRS